MLPLWRSQQEIFTHFFYHFQLSGIIDGYQHKKKQLREIERDRQTYIRTENRETETENIIYSSKNILFYKIHVLDSPKIICT